MLAGDFVNSGTSQEEEAEAEGSQSQPDSNASAKAMDKQPHVDSSDEEYS